nr:DUF3325 domain-containing protein [Acinetobacter sp. Marseille-Q1620]
MIWFLFIWSISTLGFFCLASSMSKHQKQIFGDTLELGKTSIAKISGWILLITALILCIYHDNISIGISYWLGSLTFAALFVAWCLSYFAGKIKKIAVACTILALLSAVILII